MSQTELAAVLADVKGAYAYSEALELYALAITVEAPQIIVEIGSWLGRSTCILACDAQVPVYAIDPRIANADHQFGDADRIEWAENVLRHGLMARVRPINLPSILVPHVLPNPVGLLFVDGDHAFESTFGDLEAWLPRVIPGGYVVCHDIGRVPVVDAIDCFKEQLEVIKYVDTSAFMRKRSLA